jgi:hypothetical protein
MDAKQIAHHRLNLIATELREGAIKTRTQRIENIRRESTGGDVLTVSLLQ